jgi:hypothetical protein
MLTEKDELFHETDPEVYHWAETNWFQFMIPEENLTGEVYAWFRPNLRVAASGLFVWKGFNKHMSDGYYVDYMKHLPYPDTNLDNYTLANGMHIEILESMKKYRVDYDDSQGTELHMEFEAICPPFDYAETTAVKEYFRGGGHMEQPGFIRGDLIVRGKRHTINCIHWRDHSWGPRPERAMGDVDWLVGGMGADFHFTVMSWHDREGENLKNGYIIDHGRHTRLAKAWRSTVRDADGLESRQIDLELEDVEGRQYRMKAEVKNMFPWSLWMNVVDYAGLLRWEIEGKGQGWGEVQDVRTLNYIIKKKEKQRVG